jgi:cell fate regulator YaaT (PSP1 superfamily)
MALDPMERGTKMKTVVGVQFYKSNKVYYFSPNQIACKVGDDVVVETARGAEIARVAQGPMDVDDEKIVSPLKNVVRLVTPKDRAQQEKNRAQEADALKIFEKKIAEHKLEMKPVSVEYGFDGSNITFFFTADGRVDFRELVKDLAHQFRTRIELRQIGVRDEAKLLGGLGKCGCPVCCQRFLPEFSPVSIKMAKEQNISLNPTKISGLCGRLMCCLNYEQPYYEEMRKKLPRNGSNVKTPDGIGVAMESNPISLLIKVRIQKPDETFEIREYKLDEISFERTKPPKKQENKPKKQNNKPPEGEKKRRKSPQNDKS